MRLEQRGNFNAGTTVHLFTAALLTETNTFSDCPSGRPAFEESGLLRGDASERTDESIFAPLMKLWKELGVQQGWEVTESLCTFAQPGGTTPRTVYEEFRAAILEDAKSARRPDVILLALHGAMVAEGYDDCEGDLGEALRELCGDDVVLGAVIDPHCHLSTRMLRHFDVLIAYKEYPHTDVAERSIELFELCRSAALGEVKPTTRAVDCQMIAMWRTKQSPGMEIVALMNELENQPNVLSVSFGHGFPWADVADVGARCWAITDGAPQLATNCAIELAEKVIATREQVRPAFHSPSSAIEVVNSSAEGLIVLADVADNPGGGGMADSTFILRAFLERSVQNGVLGLYWDPAALEICLNAGVGAELKLRFGGKCGKSSGDPLDLRCKVREIRENHQQPGLSGSTDQVGTAVWLECCGLDLVVTSIRSQAFSPAVFTDLGIPLEERRFVVVKSIEHFAAGFGPLAAQVLYVDTPGALRQDFAEIPYTKRDRDFWPCIDEPRANLLSGASA